MILKLEMNKVLIFKKWKLKNPKLKYWIVYQKLFLNKMFSNLLLFQIIMQSVKWYTSKEYLKQKKKEKGMLK